MCVLVDMVMRKMYFSSIALTLALALSVTLCGLFYTERHFCTLRKRRKV